MELKLGWEQAFPVWVLVDEGQCTVVEELELGWEHGTTVTCGSGSGPICRECGGHTSSTAKSCGSGRSSQLVVQVNL
jgi:hypothetical protein